MKSGLVLLVVSVALSCVFCSAVKGAGNEGLAAGGKCKAKLTYDESGKLTDVDTDAPCIKAKIDDHNESGAKVLRVNGEPLVENTGSITFGNGTTTCYGPPIPSPPICICTKKPCP